MEVSTMSHICRYYVFSWDGKYTRRQIVGRSKLYGFMDPNNLTDITDISNQDLGGDDASFHYKTLF